MFIFQLLHNGERRPAIQYQHSSPAAVCHRRGALSRGYGYIYGE